MTEKEKMLAGALYRPGDDDALLEEYLRAHGLCREINGASLRDPAGIKTLLRRLIGKISENAVIVPPFHCDYGSNIEIGENFFANSNLVVLDCAAVRFGDNVFIGPNCGFYTAGHPIDAERRNRGLEYARPIRIGDNVWIGGNVVVLPGVTLGDNVVVGAGSVVTRDIPSGMVAAGNPCRTLRRITDEDRHTSY